MTDSAILDQVALGYSPFIDRNRAVIATRLTVLPLRPDAVLDAGQLLHAVAVVWPSDGGRVSLSVASESLLPDLLRAQPANNVMIEIPAFTACDEANVEAIRTLHANGNTLLLKGRPVKIVPRELLPCFTYSIIDLADDRRARGAARAPPEVTRSIGCVQAGVRTVAEMEASFERGAQAMLGWPIEDAIATARAQSGKSAAQPDRQVVAELIRRVDLDEPVERLEFTLKRDPPSAFKLMRYIHSPALGPRVEIGSVGHAIMLLGYRRLRRWLALLLATAGRDANQRPVLFAAVRRGLLMEELVRSSGDEEMRNEMFICGAFSLLDQMFGEPFSEVLKSVSVPERVYQALAEGTGPYQPYAELVHAVESESLYDFRGAAENLMMSVSEINHAELRALAAAAQL